MKLSIVIPAHNEEGSIGETIRPLSERLQAEGIDHEILIVNDHSTDRTEAVVAEVADGDPRIRCIASTNPNGFGYTVRAGLDAFEGDAVAIMMADGSDSPDDLVAYYRLLDAGYDCAFGSRFMAGGHVIDYPRLKLIANRVVNLGIRTLFAHGYDDTTNAFKAYRREVIETVQPLVAPHFNLTVEIPLKAIVRGHTYAVTPISWANRTSGESKLRLKEMGSRYLFIVLMVFFERHLSRGDYRRNPSAALGRWRSGKPSVTVHPGDGAE